LFIRKSPDFRLFRAGTKAAALTIIKVNRTMPVPRRRCPAYPIA
jgi:hypothetical protein